MVVLGGAGLNGQVAVPSGGAGAAATAVDTSPPDPLATMRAFRAVDGWVRAWSVGTAEGLPIARAAAVTLRLDGEVVGRGVDVAVRPEGDAAVTVLAAKAALAEAEARLPVARDALYEDTLRDLAKRMTVSVELAGPLVPISPKEWGEATLAAEPGVEGVGVRLGERTAVMFPEAMLVTATEASSALSALVSKLVGDPTAGLKRPAELAKESGAVFYRFGVSHLAQPRAGSGPEFLHRGGKVYEQKDMTGAELRRWADAMADHLSRLRSGAELSPVNASQGHDSDAGRALAAMALVQYSETPGGSPERFVESRRAAARLLAGLSENSGGGECGIGWVALRGLAVEGSDASLAAITGDAQRLRDLFARVGLCMDESPRSEPARQTVVTWAKVRRAVEHRTATEGLNAEIREQFRQALPGQLVTLMPWLGWTELSWTRIETGDGPSRAIPSAQALRDMRDLVWQHQLRAFDLPYEQRDLAGAIVFTKAATGERVMPTWQAARPLAFIATMLGDERLTDDAEVPAELSRLLSSLRFLRQLTAGEAEAHMYRYPEKAIGGVRASLFDQRMAPEATALTLITVCETIRSLDRIEKRRAGKPAEEPAGR